MDPQARKPPRMALWLGLVFALILGAGGTFAWLLAKAGARRPVRVLLVTAPQPEAAGLDPAECRAIGALVQDHLECFGGMAVTTVTRMPEDLAPLTARPGTQVLVLEPRRTGMQLALSFRSAEVGPDSLQGGLRWSRTEARPQEPIAAFGQFSRDRGLSADPRPGILIPNSAPCFWDLLRAGALRLRNEHLEEATALAQKVVLAAPDCASGWILLGNLQYRGLLNNPQAYQKDQEDAETLLAKGLARLPDHPRGTFLLALMKTDNGDARDALALLVQARRAQPNNPLLLTGLAYAARNAGLLVLARRAMDLRDNLTFPEYLPQAVDMTCLYTGEVARFEASLRDEPGHLRNTSGVVPFYRGYLALVRGDRDGAHAAFTVARQAPLGYPSIVRLAEVFDLILEGRKQEAWQRLRAFDQDRLGMREPDGEFTLRLAEAYALMGDRASALEMANRAFARGFGCTAWYEKSPLLASLHGLPRWESLLQHLRERQRLMEETFPASLVESPS